MSRFSAGDTVAFFAALMLASLVLVVAVRDSPYALFAAVLAAVGAVVIVFGESKL